MHQQLLERARSLAHPPQTHAQLGLLDAIPAGGRIIMMSSEIEALAKIDLSDIK